MEPWQVVFITLYGGVLGYLLLSQIQQGKTIAAISATLDQIVEKQDKIDEKFNMFIRTEIDMLKELTKQNFDNKNKQARR